MRLPPEVLRASYHFCGRMCREARSSFYASFLLLPPAKRQAMHALYAFMRHTDDLADDPRPAHLRGTALSQWRTAVQQALTGGLPFQDGEGFAVEQPGRALLPGLADTVRRYGIPVEHLHAVIDGVETDLKRRRYESFEQLRRYCHQVASAVGLACIYIWGFRGPEALEPARHCGVAFQLTNILRDLKEDAENDRVYLPQEDLRQCGYTIDDLLRGVGDERFLRLVDLQVARAERFYREGAQLMQWLQRDGRRIFGMMMATYRALLQRIKRRPHEVLSRQVRLDRWQKLRIAARWALLPPRAAALV